MEQIQNVKSCQTYNVALTYPGTFIGCRTKAEAGSTTNILTPDRPGWHRVVTGG